MPVRLLLSVVLVGLAAAGCETATRCTVCDCLEFKAAQRKAANEWITTNQCGNFMCQHGRNLHKNPEKEPPPLPAGAQPREVVATEAPTTATN